MATKATFPGTAHSELLDTDTEACKRLWASVLVVWLEDLRGNSRNSGGANSPRTIALAQARIRDDALRYRYSDRSDPGSLIWICGVLDLNYHKVCAAADKISRGELFFAGRVGGGPRGSYMLLEKKQWDNKRERTRALRNLTSKKETGHYSPLGQLQRL